MAITDRIRIKPKEEKNLVTRQFDDIMDRETNPDYKRKIKIKDNKNNYGKDFI